MVNKILTSFLVYFHFKMYVKIQSKGFRFVDFLVLYIFFPFLSCSLFSGLILTVSILISNAWGIDGEKGREVGWGFHLTHLEKKFRSVPRVQQVQKNSNKMCWTPSGPQLVTATGSHHADRSPGGALTLTLTLIS